ncbi:ABC transporter substrate-binding protein [Marinomonas foliarum]|uniref:Carbohydrate ABC transporter substrate-binding protein n=1 Tax=Marinomonas foliarum TaxID=491950 RepID=A0A369AF66_9GAMM|nr:ABC transporter substrate-binding protein [Marinomonas foliarum]QRV25560.1 carbohydrate ABC transporter substrate-binding protein [Marinomonas foliarum]RCX06807.1 maltose-binding protein /trehalose-binding protein /sucrose-binding protein [Marinomonas foliarum]
MKKSLLSAAVALTLSANAVHAADLMFTPGEDSRFSWSSYDALKSTKLSGETISVFGPWMGDEKGNFERVVAYFEQATGAKVNYAGSDSFEQQIVIDAQAGSAPNISVFPQPGLAADLAAKGFIAPLSDTVKNAVVNDYAAGQSWVDLASFKNQKGNKEFFGVFYRADLKSLVWYSPDNFQDAGYDVPETMEDLKSLTEQIVADGGTPWCIGLGSGAATGWPATDWVEDLMLRTQPASVYDKWVTNEIKFDDPRVVGAIEEFGWFARNDDFVDGGAGAVSSTDFRDSPKGLFQSPPKCYLHRQASFIPAFFPEGTELGLDADFFYFPSYESKDLGNPVLGAGTLVSITNDSKGARAFIDFIRSPIAHELWMAQTGFISAHLKANPETYASETAKKQGEILRYATTFRFDASDLMPGKIGAGSFWTGMVDYTGGKDAKEVANDIQKTWDALK